MQADKETLDTIRQELLEMGADPHFVECAIEDLREDFNLEYVAILKESVYDEMND
jgi:hypothetical protein